MTNECLHMNEGVVDVPAQFEDRSIHILEWRRDDGSKIAMTVQREPMEDGEDLDGRARRMIADYYRELSSFRIDGRRPVEGAGVPALFLSFRWHGDHGLVCQAQGFAQIGRKLVLITTTTADAKLRPEAERIVLDALAGLRVRDATKTSELAL